MIEKFCKNCQKKIPKNKKGFYKDFCGYECYLEHKNKARKLSDFTK